MRRISFLIISCFIIITSCDDNKKIIPYLKDKKELTLSFLNQNFITNFGFLFIIDTSGSMSSLRLNLADKLNLYLEPILKKHPYYNYHFAFTTMSPKEGYDLDNKPLYLENFLDECGYSENIKFKNSNIGDYLQYSYNFSNKSDIENLLCVLKLNIKNIAGYDSGSESYFQSLDYILDNSDPTFKKSFFKRNKILNLFFISDSWHGVTYEKNLLRRTQDAGVQVAEDLANKYINKFRNFFDIQKNLRSYAVTHSAELSDNCDDSEGTGDTPNNYPFHVYKFVEKTNGLRLSICDESWGEKLGQVSDQFLSSFKLLEFFLDEFPKIDSIEVYFNDRKIPNDFEEGWFFDSEQLAIKIGSKFNWSYYISITEKELAESKLRILYHPMNLQIFQKGSKK